MGWLGRAHDHSGLIDPDATRDVDDAKARVENVRLIDQRGMLDRSFRDPRTCGLAAARVKRDGDDLETPWS